MPLPQDVADACRTGAATDIIFGLALGYKSTIIPCIVIAADAYVANSLAGMFGVACCALGMLTTLATGLAIDAYGPISDNAGGIAEMAGMGEDIRERTGRVYGLERWFVICNRTLWGPGNCIIAGQVRDHTLLLL